MLTTISSIMDQQNYNNLQPLELSKKVSKNKLLQHLNTSSFTNDLLNAVFHKESAHQKALFSSFQAWALQNYGENGKTITVTKKKYQRVVNILKGSENNVADNSKLRFWIKSKGFQLGRGSEEFEDADQDVLFIPAKVPL